MIKSSSLKVILPAILCNMLWGSAYPGIKMGYEAFNIITTSQKLLFAGIRFIIAGIIVLGISIPIQKKLPSLTKKSTPLIFITAIIYTALQYIFFYIGLSNTSGTNGSIVNSTTTFMAVILSHFVYKNDKITFPKLFGTIIGFIGVLTVCFSEGIGKFRIDGEGFIMIAALCFVVGSMISKRASADSDAFTVTGYNLLIGGIILSVSGILLGGRLDSVNLTGIINLLYLAVLSAAAFTIWTLLLKHNNVGSISVYNFIIPLFGSFLSALFLHENIFKPEYAAALVLVSLGIIIVNKGSKISRIKHKNF